MPQGNRVYIAGKVGQSEGAIKPLIKRLEVLGYEVTYDWTLNVIKKPFAEHTEEAGEAGELMMKAVMHADIVIVFVPADGGAGLFFEAGGAMLSSMILSFIQGQQRKRIYAVGEGNDRSVFFFHKSIIRVDSPVGLFEDGHLPPVAESQAAG